MEYISFVKVPFISERQRRQAIEMHKRAGRINTHDRETYILAISTQRGDTHMPY